MDLQILRDSIYTSMRLELFPDRSSGGCNALHNATIAHVFKSESITLNQSQIRNLENFNVERLQHTPATAYPKSNRPRGVDDLRSVRYWLKQRKLPRIWVYRRKNKKLVLLDGVHRIVANHIEGNQSIQAFVVSETPG